MSVVGVGANEVFLVKTHKAILLSPETVWTNSYLVRASASGSSEGLFNAAFAIASFETKLLLEHFRHTHVTVSTWTEDTVPYDANEFMTIPYGAQGIALANGDPLPLNYTLSLRKTVNSGYSGKIALRGILGEGDVQAQAGNPALSNISAWATKLDAAVTSSGLTSLLADSEGAYKLIVGSPTLPLSIRIVEGLSVLGASFRKTRVRRKRVNPTA